MYSLEEKLTKEMREKIPAVIKKIKNLIEKYF